MHYQEVIACHDCDLLQKLPRLNDGESARCTRCGACLYTRRKNTLNRSLAMVLTAFSLFVIANVFPFLSLNSQGQVVDSTLLSGSVALFEEGSVILSSVVLLTTFVFPLAHLLGLTYILLLLKFRRQPWRMRSIFRFVRHAQPWAMLEVLLLAVLVSSVKLADFAIVIPGVALYSFVGLILILAAVDSVLDPHLVWRLTGARQ